MVFSSQHKICKQVCFNKIVSDGIMLNSAGLRLVWAINDVTFARIAIRVPKKEISGAVERNKVKRLLREVVRDKINDIPSFDYLIICKRSLLACSNQEIKGSLLTLLHNKALSYDHINLFRFVVMASMGR